MSKSKTKPLDPADVAAVRADLAGLRPTYEYKVVPFKVVIAKDTSELLERALNGYGVDGWELVVMEATPPEVSGWYRLTFKRRVR